MTAVRVVFGATSFSNCSHFPMSAGSTAPNPVMLPPGRARLFTQPSPMGSRTSTKTIGIVRVWSRNEETAGGVLAKITSGERPTSSPA